MVNSLESRPSDITFHLLDLKNPTVKWSIDGKLLQQKTPKFVKIEVSEVINPDKIPLSFSLYYHGTRNEKILLGVFSLFPPDNPGSFIVATAGKLNQSGDISLTLEPLKVIDQQQKLQVKIKPFSFILK